MPRLLLGDEFKEDVFKAHLDGFHGEKRPTALHDGFRHQASWFLMHRTLRAQIAARGHERAGNHPHGGGFASGIGAEKTNDFALVNMEADIVK